MATLNDVRAKQRAFLKSTFGTNKERSQRSLPPSVFLWGLPNTGKTLCLDKCLEESGIPYQVYINSLEAICGVKGLLLSILRQLCHQSGRDASDKITYDSPDAFIDQIQSLEELDRQPVVIVVDHAHLLRAGNEEVLPLLMRLQEYTQHNVCTVLLSHFPWTSYSHVSDCAAPLQLHFPQYTAPEIVQVVLSHPPANACLEAVEFYVQMVVRVHYSSCRDLKYLSKLVVKGQEAFLVPFGQLAEPSQQALNSRWKLFHSELRRDFERNRAGLKLENDLQSNVSQMPATLVFLLLAAYISSVNPPSSDRQIFVKGKSGSKQKFGESSARSGKSGVPHSRLLSIFRHISESKYPPDTTLIWSIEELCGTGFLARVGSSGSLDEPKYRVNVSGDFAQKLGDLSGVKLEEILVSRR